MSAANKQNGSGGIEEGTDPYDETIIHKVSKGSRERDGVENVNP